MQVLAASQVLTSSGTFSARCTGKHEEIVRGHACREHLVGAAGDPPKRWVLHMMSQAFVAVFATRLGAAQIGDGDGVSSQLLADWEI